MNRHRRILSRIVALAVLLTLAATCLHSQTDPDPTPLLRTAVAKFDAAKQSKTRFTYYHLDHTQNFNLRGKLILEYTRLYEVTYIADLEYQKLLEKNGKPLTGRALEREEKRYEEALRQRSALDEDARAKLVHLGFKRLDSKLDLLATKFRNAVVGHDQLDGRDCLLIDSTPLQSAVDAPQRHYRIWLDPVQAQILRVDYQMLADESGIHSGGALSDTWNYIDGIPVCTRDHVDFVARFSIVPVHVIADHAYSHFRRFVATTRILPDPSDGSQP
jgi:hypothetical protein